MQVINVSTPRGSVRGVIDEKARTVVISMPTGERVVLQLRSWTPLLIQLIIWVIYWIAWWWASGKLRFSLLSRILGLFLPGIAVIVEALIR